MLLLPLYISALGISAGLAGVTARRFLALAGLAPDFETGLIAAWTAAAAWLAVQFGWMTALRFLKPSRDSTPLLSEIFSLAAVIALLPLLAGFSITSLLPESFPVSARPLAKIEPLIYLALFTGIHGFFKLVTLFGAAHARVAGRAAVIGWAAAAALSAWGAFSGALLWRNALDEGVAAVEAGKAAPAAFDGTWTSALRLREGVRYDFDIRDRDDAALVFYWRLPADAEEKIDRIYLSLDFDADTASPRRQTAPLRDDGWSILRVPGAEIPAAAARCTLRWFHEEDAPWVRLTGIRPVQITSRDVLLAGPRFHAHAAPEGPPSMIVLAVEGLAAAHMSLFGYERETTPVLDAFCRDALVWENAFTPAPDTAAACMSLFTGVNPLTHGYLEPFRGLLPDQLETLAESMGKSHIATAAFTEGVGPDDEDLFHGSGFERGFEFFNTEYPTRQIEYHDGTKGPVVPKGSKYTLQKAADWIADHAEDRFFLFIRLRELRIPYRLYRYGEGFLGKGREPEPRDIYDTALADLDRRIGAFLDTVRAMEGGQNRAILITSTHGFDFSEPGRGAWRRGGEAKRNLKENALRIPVILALPHFPGKTIARPVSLFDVTPALARIMETALAHDLEGQDLIEDTDRDYTVSMQGEPLALSLRDRDWRFTWQSGCFPFRPEKKRADSGVIEFINIGRMKEDLAPVNNLRRQPARAQVFQGRLDAYLRRYSSVPLPGH
jgi:hypothetical protein